MNDEVRTAARKAGVPLWKVAELLAVSEATFTRMMRKELPQEKKAQIMVIIQEVEKHG